LDLGWPRQTTSPTGSLGAWARTTSSAAKVSTSWTANGGDDLLRGGPGGDDFLADEFCLTISYSVGPDAMKSAGSALALLAADLNTGQATGYGNVSIDVLVGDAGADTLIGNDVANRLIGLRETITLKGRGGNDSRDGGDDTDFLDGGAGAHDDCFQEETILNCE
jgi:Ca2+-binding RTX toxin-like protein